MPICTACRKFPLGLFTDFRCEPFELHPSLTELLASALAGCNFCDFLQRQLDIDCENALPQPSKIVLFTGGYSRGDMTCQADEPDPWDVENPRSLHASFQFAVEPFEGTRRPITGDTRSEETFLQIEKWLEECDAGHSNCRLDSGESFAPARLLDLQSMTTSTDRSPKLILAADLPSEHVNYVAFSYARSSNVSQDSNPQARRTTEENMNEHLSSGISFSELPLTIREGIDIAQRLKIRYIWDPSLCIIQDSPSDWTVQSTLIPKIYANAYVTIAASASIDIHGGYFRDAAKTTEQDSAIFSVSSPAPWPSWKTSREERKEVQVFVMKAQLDWGSIFNASALNKCAWALQEREFSSRILHFTETQVLWECRALRASEGLPESNAQLDHWWKFPLRLLDGLHELEFKANGSTNRNMWLQTLADYSRRRLERAEDKFPALSSLAQIFANHISAYPGDYIAGFWRQDLVRSLSWGCLTIGTNGAVTNRRNEKFVAPTWSWASVDGPVDFSYVKKIDYSVFSFRDYTAIKAVKLMPEIRGVNLSRLTPSDPFGQLKVGANLRLRGYIVRAALGNDSSSDGSSLGYDGGSLGQQILLDLIKAGSSPHQQRTGEAEAVGTMYFDVPSERAALDPKEEVFVLYLHPWYRETYEYRFRDGGKGFSGMGIALARIGTLREGREGELPAYKRVGHVKPLSVYCFEGVRQEEIVIF